MCAYYCYLFDTASPNPTVNISEANGCIVVNITDDHLDELVTLGAMSHLNFTCDATGNSALLQLTSLDIADMFCSDNTTMDNQSLGEVIGGCQTYSVAVSVFIDE